MKPLVAVPQPSLYRIEKYKAGRFWAITHVEGGQLVAVTAYKKGARQLVTLLDELERLRRVVAGLRLINDLVEPKLAMVADRPLRSTR